MNYKHCCVIDTNGYYRDLVLVVDGTIQYYSLNKGETLIDAPTPADFIKPRWNGKEWTEGATAEEIAATMPTLDEAKVAKKAEIASDRYNAEVGGMDFYGMKIATDRESVSLIQGAVLQTVFDTKYILQWKTALGFVTLTAEQLQALGTAVRVHVQACFDREAELNAQIDASKTVKEVNAIKWIREVN